jgi:predicted chitinase
MNSSLPSVVPSLNSTTESSFISSLMPTPNVTSQPSSRPSNSFYPTFNSSSSVINVISSPPSNNASSTLTPSQHPTISALPTREANYTHNASIASNYSTNPESSVPIVALSNLGPTNCVITETVFNTIAPQAAPPFSYAGFCKAVSDWNMRNPNNPIFVADQTHELAAFFGNTLHESDGFTAPREYKVCRESITDSNGKMYCKPPLYNGGLYTDDYCSTEHNRTSDPDGCACLRQVPEALSQPGYVEADLLFFGRGALHLSWNYNYIDAGGAIGVDLCTNPDLAASDEEYVWTSAFYFWTMNTGKGETCTQSVAAGSFGGTVNIINGGLECPATGLSSASSVISRLDDYCAASTALGADSLLDLKGCKGLQSQFDFCSSTKLCSSCSEWA